MTVYNFAGEAANTDLGDVTDWTRLTGTANDIETNASENLDFASTAAEQAYAVDAGDADHFVESTYATFANALGFIVALRMTDSQNAILLRYNSGWTLFNRVLGTFDPVDSTASGVNIPTDGDRIRGEVVGTTVNIYKNDVLILGPNTITDHSTVTNAGIAGRDNSRLNLLSQIEIGTLYLNGPDETTVDDVRIATGLGLDTPTTSGLKIDDDSYSLSLTIDAQTATTLTQTDDIGTPTSGTPVDSLPVKANVLAAGATPYVIQQWVNDGVNPEVVRNIVLNYLAGYTTVQFMVATANTTPGESFVGTDIIPLEDDLQMIGPDVVDTVTITYFSDGTFATDKFQTITFDLIFWSKSTGQESVAGVTVLGSAIISSGGITRALIRDLVRPITKQAIHSQ